ncbi:MAG: hypothetical protein AAFY08_14670 [Planctomycetota bacterium]
MAEDGWLIGAGRGRARRIWVAWLALMAVLAGGCSVTDHVNPSMPLDRETAAAELAAMEAEPRPMQRPLLLLNGWGDWGGNVTRLRERYVAATGDERVVGVSFPFAVTYEGCRDKVINALEAAYPSDDPDETVEVDAVALSMGGVIAVYAAAPPKEGENRKRLKLNTLYTISVPLRGSQAALAPAPDPMLIALNPLLPFMGTIRRLQTERDYEIVPYVRLGDGIVGFDNAAPPGESPYWVSNGAFQDAHNEALKDDRIHADILRKLRGEAGYTRGAAAPPP